jgi:hypothetical protein
MYHFSRSIYRELAPRVVEDEWDPTGCRNKQAVLDACESTVRRLTYDRRYFRRPARWLFREIRPHFSMCDQLFVWQVVETNIHLALEYLASLPEGTEIDGVPVHCHAYTRRGTACERTPLPGRDYCPSHKHLEENFEEVEIELPAAA